MWFVVWDDYIFGKGEEGNWRAFQSPEGLFIIDYLNTVTNSKNTFEKSFDTSIWIQCF
jgi:hypothetical protein